MEPLAVALGCVLAAGALPPTPQREFRGVWVATVDNIDYPSKPGLPAARMRGELLEIVRKVAALHMNAIVFQVRPSADALYRSKLEPWSWYLTGEQGKAPEGSWDPLAFLVREAHKRGIEVHAWFNPYRALHPAQKGECCPEHVSQSHPGSVKKYGKFLWMDPGDRFVQERTLAVILDVVRRYDVDGVHLDDYFYPYPVKQGGVDVGFPDDDSWSAYRATGGRLSRSAWRRSNVDYLMQSLYRRVKRAKPWVKVGISPFGIYRPEVPEGIHAGLDQVEDLYADPLKWLQKGWCDYLVPQLYWPIDQKAQAYPKLLEWWLSQNTRERHLWAGNYASGLAKSKSPWSSEEILNQIEESRKQHSGGNVFFSAKVFMHDAGGIDEALVSGPYHGLALVPRSPWLGKRLPKRPTASFDFKAGLLRVSSAAGVRFAAVYVRRGGAWGLERVGAGALMKLGSPSKVQAVAVSSVDRFGNESRRLVLTRAKPSKAVKRRRSPR